MVTLESIREARARIRAEVHHTPLLASRTIGELTGTRFFIKAESLQKTGSFKVRGALNRVAGLSPEEKAGGLVAVSAGNHAQALAYAARAEGVPCTVVMPEGAVRSKVEASRGYGADVVLHGTVFQAFEKCEALRIERDLTFIHPFDDLAIMAGQGTVGLEILEDLPEPDLVLVPVGGGGLISGVAAAIKALRPATRVVGVEPTGAAAVTAALRAGEIVPLDRIDTVADGLSAPATGPLALAHIRRFVDDVVTVDDEAIIEALRLLLERAKLLVEPAGAAGAAALLTGAVSAPAGARVVAVASGGNLDLSRLGELVG